MEVTIDKFLEDENKKVTIFKIVPEIDKQDFALQKLMLAVNNYMKDKPRSIYYNKIDTPFMIIVIEGINC